MKYIIGYDISDPKRLQRVHRKMSKFATPIQYSIFLFEGTLSQLDNKLEIVLDIINKKQDDVRVYSLPSNGKQWRLGKSSLPEGIIWTALPLSLQN